MNDNKILELINQTTTPQIKAGEVHRFNDIWLVVADNRVFCRQYSFGTNSWYTAFLEDENGYVKCGETIIKVKGIIPGDLNKIGEKINEAYIEKYAIRLKHYPDIAYKMTGKRYMDSTMELIIVETIKNGNQ